MNPGVQRLLIGLVLVCCRTVYGDHAAAFLDLAIGGRAGGMGMAFTAVAEDGTAFYWNPAGLAQISGLCFSGMAAPLFGKNPMAKLFFFGLAASLDPDACLSANWVRLSVEDIPVFSELEGNGYQDRLKNESLRPSGIPEDNKQFFADTFYFSFARRMRTHADPGWRFHKVRIEILGGASVKILRCVLGGFRASGIGVDAGGLIRIHLDDFFEIENFGTLMLGARVADLASSRLGWNTGHTDSRTSRLRTGLSFVKPLPGKDHHLLVCMDGTDAGAGTDAASCTDTDTGPSTVWCTGMEYRFRALSLRLGVSDGHFTCGAGLRSGRMCADYAFLSHDLGGSHRISVSWTF